MLDLDFGHSRLFFLHHIKEAIPALFNWTILIYIFIVKHFLYWLCSFILLLYLMYFLIHSFVVLLPSLLGCKLWCFFSSSTFSCQRKFFLNCTIDVVCGFDFHDLVHILYEYLLLLLCIYSCYFIWGVYTCQFYSTFCSWQI